MPPQAANFEQAAASEEDRRIDRSHRSAGPPERVLGAVSTLGENVGAGTHRKIRRPVPAVKKGEIFNEVGEAKFRGRIKFTGVTIVDLAGCSTVGGAVETEAPTESIGMKKDSGPIDTVEVTPLQGGC